MKLVVIALVVSSVAYADPLTVEVKPATLAWHVNKPVDVTLRVVNTSKTKQSFHAMNCSWFQHWKSHDPTLGWEHWGCEKNYAALVELEPGKAYEQKLPMIATADGKHVLQMDFTPEGGPTTSSAEIAITVER